MLRLQIVALYRELAYMVLPNLAAGAIQDLAGGADELVVRLGDEAFSGSRSASVSHGEETVSGSEDCCQAGPVAEVREGRGRRRLVRR